MTVTEMSNEFDVLYNNIMSNQAPGLNSYEKSVFLTNALYQMIISYFDPRGNKFLEGIDDSLHRLYDFSTLIKVASLAPYVGSNAEAFDSRGKLYAFPVDCLLPLNELLTDGVDIFTILPLKFTEYSILMTRPYKYPPRYLAWRLLNSSEETSIQTVSLFKENLTLKYNGKEDVSLVFLYGTGAIDSFNSETSTVTVAIEQSPHNPEKTLFISSAGFEVTPEIGAAFCNLIANAWLEINRLKLNTYKVEYTFKSPKVTSIIELIAKFKNENPTYKVRYVKRPSPIIVDDLYNDYGEGVTIEGEDEKMGCVLPPECHHEIVLRAVELAKASYTGDLNSMIALGLNSQTNMGIVAQSSK